MNRRQMLGAACAFTGAIPMGRAAAEAGFPTRPIKIVVPFAPGGAGDAVARIIGDKVQADLGQALVVENKSGGNTVIGTQAVASARPDGYTLLQTTASNVIITHLQEKLPYDPDKAFVPVAGIGAVPLAVAVNGKSKLRTIADLVALAKATPKGIFYSSGGTGSQTHVAPVWFTQLARMPATHVAFRGGGPAAQAVVADQVQFTFASTIAVQEFSRTGQLRLIAVTSEQRVPSLPEVPTMVEQGFAEFTPMLWYGYLAPAGTPKDVIDRLHGAFANAAADPQVKERLAALGLVVKVRGPTEFGQFIREESGRWGRVIRENKIKLE
jgi:tripartite-type tricarboxylate transporter receptor subunit TctC